MASCAETAEPVLATSNIPIQMATESFARSQATMAVECIRVLQCYEAGARRLREELTLKLTQKLFPCTWITWKAASIMLYFSQRVSGTDPFSAQVIVPGRDAEKTPSYVHVSPATTIVAFV